MSSQVTQQSENLYSRIKELLEQGEVAEAMALIEGEPIDTAFARTLLSHARKFHVSGHLAEQKRICEIILAHLPGEYEALHLLGFYAQTCGDYALAERYYKQALAGNPGFAFSQLALAQLRMMQTGFREGRTEYEARFEAVTEGSGPDWRGLPYPRWCGKSVTGKKLYLWAEQGLGDIVMFAGFLPALLAQRPERIALGMFPKLISLFTRSFPNIAIEPIDEAAMHALAPTMLGAFPQIEALASQIPVPFSLDPLRASYDYAKSHGLFDIAAPMGDLLVHLMPDYLPARQPPYLVADPVRVEEVRQKLASLGPGKRIGISWYTSNMRETTRTIPLADMLPLLRMPDCHFISLQHHVARAEIEHFCKENGCTIITDVAADLTQDAEALAALIDAMDEVVTIDNSNVHLAGALGVKTTLLLPKGSNYRWPEQADDSTLWYKSVTALRQKELSNWREIIAFLIDNFQK